MNGALGGNHDAGLLPLLAVGCASRGLQAEGTG